MSRPVTQCLPAGHSLTPDIASFQRHAIMSLSLVSQQDWKCMREVGPHKLANAAALDAVCRDGCAWAPSVGGKTGLEDYPWKLVAAGKHAKVPIMQGDSADEGYAFVMSNNFYDLGMRPTEHEVHEWAALMFGRRNVDDISRL